MLMNLLKQSQEMSLTALENELREQGMFNYVFHTLNVKSKKKRIRKKVLKRAVALVNVIEDQPETNVIAQVSTTKNEKVQEASTSEVIRNVAIQEEITQEESSQVSFNFKKTPVTLLLKIGKRFLGEKNVVKYYYNANHEEFYKNKELLVNVFEIEIPKLATSIQQDIQVMVEEQQKKKTKA
ncbi:hypothetical protein [Bacillus thuringiensis]|uniref:hypothetical protein n=1 Tax=Bacillus thuringiensis TaxID=1428 RepID=UPI0021D669FF|nr:hypothetical protein [Bacillus thuringiensis]MCU7666783.1 hypothetical protein [Bacillus thuringiensis]